MLQSSRKPTYLFSFALLWTLVLVYFPTVTARFAMFDDYYAWPWNILSRNCDGHPLFGYVGLVQGRILGAKIVCGLNLMMMDLGQAGWIRLGEILLVATMAISFFIWLLRASVDRWQAFFLALINFNPPHLYCQRHLREQWDHSHFWHTRDLGGVSSISLFSK